MGEMGIRSIWPLTLIITLSSCAQSISPNTYTASQVGSVNRAVEGTVISIREVIVDRNTGTGGLAGSGMGAAGGAAIGGDSIEGIIAGSIAGAVVGGLAGNAVEGSKSKIPAFEYVVRTSNGALLTLVQGGDPIAEGGAVLVIYGSPSRLIPKDKTIVSN